MLQLIKMHTWGGAHCTVPGPVPVSAPSTATSDVLDTKRTVRCLFATTSSVRFARNLVRHAAEIAFESANTCAAVGVPDIVV